MPTKYIVQSGGMRNASDKGEPFFREMVRGLGSSPRILICCFAQARERWEEKFAEDVAHFQFVFTQDVRPILTLAFPDTFEKQIQETDAIYIHGGDDHLVQYWLRKFNLPKLWEGKVVATSSASSHALAKCFWTCDWRQCMEGLGILSIKFLAHFKSEYGSQDPRGPIDWDKAYNKLERYGDQSLPIYALKEGEFVVFEI